MCQLVLLLVLPVAQATPLAPDHTQNAVFLALKGEGVRENDASARLPEPIFPDGQEAAAGLAAIRSVVGDERAVRELLRDSVTAPFVLKTRDLKAGDSTIRIADLYFAVHAKLDEIDLESSIAKADQADVEAGNMRFGAKVLGPDVLREKKLDLPARTVAISGWYSHAKGRLLDRVAVEATDRVIATRTADSILVAAKTDHAFDDDPNFPNQWSGIVRRGTEEVAGPRRIYAGGGSYVKLTRIAAEPGVLFAEAHLAFVEPHGWFQGAPILRSKISLIAQDQVRQIRREIEKNRAKK